MRRFIAAVSFLTRWPVAERIDAADIGRAAPMFPLVGALLGSGAALAAMLLSGVLPPLVVALLIVALLVFATGGIHLDGLGDMADGFGGGHDKDDVLRIMRDHAIGTYGTVALFLLLAAKSATLAALIGAGEAAPTLIVAGALSRWASLPLGLCLPYAHDRADGLGRAVTDHLNSGDLLGSTALAIAVAVAFLGWRGAVCFAAVVALLVLLGILCKRRIGGVTGDTLGASTESAELLVYLVALALIG